MSDVINIVLLAAGKGTRLKTATPKPLCLALGRKLVDFVIDGISDFSDFEKRELSYNIVLGNKKEEIQDHIVGSFPKKKFHFAVQEKQLGTGHALKTFFDAYPGSFENTYTFVVCADTPLISSDIYSILLEKIESTGSDAICASFVTENPKGYGRIEHFQKEAGFKIIEEKDASPEQKLIKEVNSGLYVFKTKHIQEYIGNIDDKNNSGEFYLTDLFQKSFNVETVIFSDEKPFLGVNNLIQLEEAENILLVKKLSKLMLSGVRMIKSSTVYIETNVQIQAESVIYPNVAIFGNSIIGKNVIIENGAIIKDSIIGDDVTIKAYSYLEGADVGRSSVVGPMARLREGSKIQESCKIGNFVEMKKSVLEKGVKVSHLSYIGDAHIGESTNIGCGFITCNYDGSAKHKTIIGKDSFIGSDCQVVAPIRIGSGVYIGSGSTINKDVPDGTFAIARQRQVNKEGMAEKFIKKT